MNVIQTIHDHLSALSIAGGVHHVQNRRRPLVVPYALTTVIAAPVNNSLRGESDLQNVVVQIDVFAEKVSECASVSAAIAQRMPTINVSSVRTDLRESFEPEVKLYRISQDFSVWSRD